MSTSGIRVSLRTARDTVSTQLWPVPTIAVVIAVAIGSSLPLVDGSVDEAIGSYLFGGDAGAARTVLDAIASSLITVTSLTFSLTVVTLQLASSQFSPRLLRTFTRDRLVHVTLALFLATFTYALTVLRSVRSSSDGQDEFVPRLAVTFGFVLALASVIGLVLFLAHLARQIRVETMLEAVRRDGSSSVRQLLDDHDPLPPVLPEPVSPAAGAKVLPAPHTGFLTQVAEDELLAAAVDCGAVVVLDQYPGAFVVAHTPVGVAWPLAAEAPFDDEVTARLQERVGAALSTGTERTAAQDIGYTLRQLTDVANKALSPGINDPTTAVHALGHSSALLCEFAGRDLTPHILRDEDGRIRVVLRRPTLADLVDLAVAQPRRYGASDPAVLARLFQLLRELAWCMPVDQRPIVDEQLGRLRDTAAAQDFDEHESRRLDAQGREVRDALAGRWTAQTRAPVTRL